MNIYKALLLDENSLFRYERFVPLCVGIQQQVPVLWFECEGEAKNWTIEVAHFPTGARRPGEEWSYIGSYQFDGQTSHPLVGHVYWRQL